MDVTFKLTNFSWLYPRTPLKGGGNGNWGKGVERGRRGEGNERVEGVTERRGRRKG